MKNSVILRVNSTRRQDITDFDCTGYARHHLEEFGNMQLLHDPEVGSGMPWEPPVTFPVLSSFVDCPDRLGDWSFDELQQLIEKVRGCGIKFRQFDYMMMLPDDQRTQQLVGFMIRQMQTWGTRLDRPIPLEVVWTDSEVIKEVLAPTPETVTLKWCITRFGEDFSNHWVTRETAEGACLHASNRFFDLLLTKGVVSNDQIRNHEAEVRIDWNWLPCSGHAYVRIGSKIIDWTARQFCESLPCPNIFDEQYPGEYLNTYHAYHKELRPGSSWQDFLSRNMKRKS